MQRLRNTALALAILALLGIATGTYGALYPLSTWLGTLT